MVEASTKLLTADEFFALEGDKRQLELVRGEVVEMPNGGWVHGLVGTRLYKALVNFVDEHGLGIVPLPSTGFAIRRDIVRKPDVAFVPKAQCPDPAPIGFLPFAPALAAEVASPHDTLREIEVKALEYLDAGTREVWLVSPFSCTVQIWSRDGRRAILSGDDRLASSELLPGFSLRVGDLFVP